MYASFVFVFPYFNFGRGFGAYFGVYFGDQRGFCILYRAQEIPTLEFAKGSFPNVALHDPGLSLVKVD